MDSSAIPPNVMVSSTFYDLRHIRDDLRRFLQDELGYRPLLSEHPSFPIDPDALLIENCRQRVEHDADVLLLVIGGRYGSIDKNTGKSVTNIEYLAARNKKIPIYAFVAHEILHVIPAWRSNPSGDFSAYVDTPQLFEFVEQVRTHDNVWVQGFSQARDIVDALRIQFAYEQRTGLLLRRRLAVTPNLHWLDDLRGTTLRIALEKPAFWEHRLFAHALIDSVARHEHLFRRHETGIPLGLGEDVTDPMTWIQSRFNDAIRMASGTERLLNQTLQEALGPPGVSGDAERIVFVAEAIGDVYSDALRWASRIRSANMDKRLERLRGLAASGVDNLIRQINEFGPYVRDTLERALSAPKTGESKVLELTLTISVPSNWESDFNSELTRAAAEFARRR